MIITTSIFILLFSLLFLFPRLFAPAARALGNRLRRQTSSRTALLVARARAEAKAVEDRQAEQKAQDRGRPASTLDEEWERVERSRSLGAPEAPPGGSPAADQWEGVVGFLHPFCNAGGGGERVLWAAVKATQERWPLATCAVYTGDHDVTKEQMLKRAEERFNIRLYAPTVVFLYLSTRQHVLASAWPRFTLLGQSLGSLIMAYDAFSLVVPDVFVDTMGYAFALALCKFLFPDVPTAAYVHYPTISTDMLGSLDAEADSGLGVNAGLGKGWKGYAKRQYWHLFAWLYGWVGGQVDVVMTNSSWTQGHIQQLWGPARARGKKRQKIEVVYPPCAVEEVEKEIPVEDDGSEAQRKPTLLYIAQFRPEKNHQMVLQAFAKFLQSRKASTSAPTPKESEPHLLLVGSVRDSADETYIYSLRLLAHELHITSSVTFLLNASWPTILSHLRTASVGINAMWNEHFGIGVVEYQAAGLIPVVNDSGGPRADICVDIEGGRTGFRASTVEEYATAFGEALGMGGQETKEMRKRVRASARRFDEASFERKWVGVMEVLVGMARPRGRADDNSGEGAGSPK